MLDSSSQVTIVSVIGVTSTVVFSYIAYLKGTKTESYSAGTVKGSQDANIDYIKQRVDDILLEQKDTNRTISKLTERVTRVEESTSSAHKRIDELERRVRE